MTPGAIDLHVDTLSRLLVEGGGIAAARNDLQVDLPRAQAGGVRALCCACFTRDDDPAPRESVARMLDLAARLAADPAHRLRIVATPDELDRLPAGAIGIIPTIENARSLEGDIDTLDAWRARGVAILGLVWNGANDLGEGCGADTGRGLTDFGRAAVHRAADLGMAIDTSHLNPAGVDEVCSLGVPVLATHSNCRAVHDHRRNLDDRQLAALASAGGILGLNLYPPFLGADPVSLATVVAHARHAAGILGADRIALGTDLDGIERTPAGFRDHRDMPALAGALGGGGFSEREVAGIFGENFRRWSRDRAPDPGPR
jgi:membrane dipeptidase